MAEVTNDQHSDQEAQRPFAELVRVALKASQAVREHGAGGRSGAIEEAAQASGRLNSQNEVATMYGASIRTDSGRVVVRYCENAVELPDITDDGETLYLFYDGDDPVMTADMLNAARATRAHWRRAYAAGGSRYPE